MWRISSSTSCIFLLPTDIFFGGKKIMNRETPLRWERASLVQNKCQIPFPLERGGYEMKNNKCLLSSSETEMVRSYCPTWHIEPDWGGPTALSLSWPLSVSLCQVLCQLLTCASVAPFAVSLSWFLSVPNVCVWTILFLLPHLRHLAITYISYLSTDSVHFKLITFMFECWDVTAIFVHQSRSNMADTEHLPPGS